MPTPLPPGWTRPWDAAGEFQPSLLADHRPVELPPPPAIPLRKMSEDEELRFFERALTDQKITRNHLGHDLLLEMTAEDELLEQPLQPPAAPSPRVQCHFCHDAVAIDGILYAAHIPRRWHEKGRTQLCPASGQKVKGAGVARSIAAHMIAGVVARVSQGRAQPHSEAIRRAIASTGLSVSALAARAQMTRAEFTRAISRRIPDSHAQAVAAALQRPIGELYDLIPAKPDFWDWAFRLFVLLQCPRPTYGRHAPVRVGEPLADLWEDGLNRATAEDRLWWADVPTRGLARTYMQAATSYACWCPIVYLLKCNDKLGIEDLANQWGRVDNALMYKRGPRRWAVRPKPQRPSVAGDLDGTFTARDGRRIHRQQLDEQWSVRKPVLVPVPITDWHSGVTYPNRFVVSPMYVTCEALQTALRIPQVRRMAQILRELICATASKEQIAGGPNPHKWLWVLTSYYRASRKPGIAYEDQIVPEKDREQWRQEKARRARYRKQREAARTAKQAVSAKSEQDPSLLRSRPSDSTRANMPRPDRPSTGPAAQKSHLPTSQPQPP